MNFTDKEIELARDMKEAGLEWIKPEYGDWYFSSYHDEPATGYLPDMLSDDSIWLPLWHQCREIMRKAGYCLADVFEKTINHVTLVHIVYFRNGIEIARSGHTDLEAMYQVILVRDLTNR